MVALVSHYTGDATMGFNGPVGERCLCKKRNELWHERENQNNLNGSYIAIISFDDILVFVCLCIAALD